jgi:hypothetical protein
VANFLLDNVDGRSVPTYVTPIPESPTIISSTLHFDFDGRATLTEHLVQMGSDITQTRTYTYTIKGGQIDFALSPPCPIDADCVGAPKGIMVGSHLLLDMSATGTGDIVYGYSLIPSMVTH